jgi:hypothetical protein
VAVVNDDEADRAVAAQAEFMVLAHRRSQERLTRLRQHPFGFASGFPRPEPVAIVSEVGSFALSGIARAILTRSSLPRIVISLQHGKDSELSGALIEIMTDFSRDHEGSNPLEYEVGRADHRDSALARGDRNVKDPDDEPSGPFGHDTADILVAAERRTVAVLTYRKCWAFRFEYKRLLVTVVGRNDIPELPAFAPVARLDTYVTRHEFERETVQAWLREQQGD